MAPHFGLKGRPLRLWLTLACSVAMMPFGYDQALFSSLPSHLSPSEHLTASYYAASFLGALSVLHFGELLGRKRTILFSTAIMACGALLQVSTIEFVQMTVGRMVSGIGNGMATATAPVWLAEMASAKRRGRMVFMMMAGSAVGFAVGNWVAFAMSDDTSFRVPMAFNFVFIILLFATVPWLPESPRWLMSKGRLIQATTTLADLEGKDKNDASNTALALRMNNDIHLAKKNRPSWKDICRGRGGSITRRLLLGIGVQVMQQLSGIAVTANFLPVILTETLGLSARLSRLLAACNATAFLLSSIGAIYIVPRFGSRKPMITSSLSQSFSLLTFTLTTHFLSPNSPKHTPIPSLLSLLLFHISFALSGWNASPWLYPIELNNQAIRTQAVALSTATGWIVSFGVVEVTSSAIDALGWKFFIVWMVMNFLFAGVVWGCYFEMEGEGLEDVDRFDWEGYPILGWGRRPDVKDRGGGGEEVVRGGGGKSQDGKEWVQMLRRDGTSVKDMAVGGMPVVMEGYTMEGASGSGPGQRQRRESRAVDPLER
ncbi:sugar transporter [Podospora aff. communis PSN243]|uniref:Sugar transporter n=1 Tax=Podospora aff. communis PSN243 TaxID=3040156 RepID=A0AAV9G9E0_9PEZI|nr:sugar transporter [Podospora aff. communis PSN243]